MTKIGGRPYFEEKPAIACGKLGYGDVSAWSKGVSRPWGSVHKPKRPECSGPVLFATGSSSEPQVISQPSIGIVCATETPTPKREVANVSRTLDICDFINAKLGLIPMKRGLVKRVTK